MRYFAILVPLLLLGVNAAIAQVASTDDRLQEQIADGSVEQLVRCYATTHKVFELVKGGDSSFVKITYETAENEVGFWESQLASTSQIVRTPLLIEHFNRVNVAVSNRKSSGYIEFGDDIGGCNSARLHHVNYFWNPIYSISTDRERRTVLALDEVYNAGGGDAEFRPFHLKALVVDEGFSNIIPFFSEVTSDEIHNCIAVSYMAFQNSYNLPVSKEEQKKNASGAMQSVNFWAQAWQVRNTKIKDLKKVIKSAPAFSDLRVKNDSSFDKMNKIFELEADRCVSKMASVLAKFKTGAQ